MCPRVARFFRNPLDSPVKPENDGLNGGLPSMPKVFQIDNRYQFDTMRPQPSTCRPRWRGFAPLRGEWVCPAVRDVGCYDQRARSALTHGARKRPTHGRKASNPQEATPPTSGHEVPILTGAKHPTHRDRINFQDCRISSSRWMRGGRSYLRISQRMSKSTAS